MSERVINGIRCAAVARMVGGDVVVTATRRERDIAKAVCRLGERMERKGYLPALRRKKMLDLMIEMANSSDVPPILGAS